MGNRILSILQEFSYEFFLKYDFTMKITSKYMVVQTRSGSLRKNTTLRVQIHFKQLSIKPHKITRRNYFPFGLRLFFRCLPKQKRF